MHSALEGCVPSEAGWLAFHSRGTCSAQAVTPENQRGFWGRAGPSVTQPPLPCLCPPLPTPLLSPSRAQTPSWALLVNSVAGLDCGWLCSWGLGTGSPLRGHSVRLGACCAWRHEATARRPRFSKLHLGPSQDRRPSRVCDSDLGWTRRLSVGRGGGPGCTSSLQRLP